MARRIGIGRRPRGRAKAVARTRGAGQMRKVGPLSALRPKSPTVRRGRGAVRTPTPAARPAARPVRPRRKPAAKKPRGGRRGY